MIFTEDFFMELIETLEIEATCLDCGRATLPTLFRRDCIYCEEPERRDPKNGELTIEGSLAK